MKIDVDVCICLHLFIHISCVYHMSHIKHPVLICKCNSSMKVSRAPWRCGWYHSGGKGSVRRAVSPVRKYQGNLPLTLLLRAFLVRESYSGLLATLVPTGVASHGLAFCSHVAVQSPFILVPGSSFLQHLPLS